MAAVRRHLLPSGSWPSSFLALWTLADVRVGVNGCCTWGRDLTNALSLLQLWIDSSAGGALPAAAEKKEKDFFAEHTQVVCLMKHMHGGGGLF